MTAVPFLQDSKNNTLWKYRKYTEEEIAPIAQWLASPQFAKEILLGENLWENMKKLCNRVGIFTHPVFEYTDYYIKAASKDVRATHQ